MMSNSEENRSSTSMAEGDPIEETLQMNATETHDPPSVPQVSTDSNDKAMFSKPLLPSKASGTQSIDSSDSTSGHDTQPVGHVESQSSASIPLSSTVNVFVHIGSCTKSQKKFIPSSPDSGSSMESFDSVPIGPSQYIGCEETQSSASVTLSSTAKVMVHSDSCEDVAVPTQYKMPARKSVNLEDQKIIKPAVDESLVRTKEIFIDTRKTNLIEQAATEKKRQFKEELQVDKSNVRLSLKKDERNMQVREQISTESKILLRKQEASGSKLQQDTASVAENEQAAANTESNLQLSTEIPSASSATSDPTSQLPEAASSTQQAPSRYPPRKIKLTADSLPSWKNMTMVQARRGRGMYGGRLRQYGEDSPPKGKRMSAIARDLPEISVQNINRGIRGRRFQKMFPSQTGLPPYRSLSERLFLETTAKVVDVTKEKKKKAKKKKRHSGFACAKEMDEDCWTSWSSSDDEPKSPKKSLPPSPELQFHLEL